MTKMEYHGPPKARWFAFRSPRRCTAKWFAVDPWASWMSTLIQLIVKVKRQISQWIFTSNQNMFLKTHFISTAFALIKLVSTNTPWNLQSPNFEATVVFSLHFRVVHPLPSRPSLQLHHKTGSVGHTSQLALEAELHNLTEASHREAVHSTEGG